MRAGEPEGGFGLILFHVPISRLASSQTLTPPSLSSPPKGASAAPPRLFPFILAVSSGGGWGCQYPKPRDLPASEKRRQQFVWDQAGGTPGAPHHPAKPPSLPRRAWGERLPWSSGQVPGWLQDVQCWWGVLGAGRAQRYLGSYQ